MVRESWRRSLEHLPDPDLAHASLFCSESELQDHRRAHPLAVIMPVIEQLLVRPGAAAGMLVAVGDAAGRLLWVDGDPALRRRAEDVLFVAGADWSEARVGTNAPGTALALRRSVQIAGAEHFSTRIRALSCTAVPVHDPESGVVLGVVDVTGSRDAAAATTLSLVQAAVAAAEAHLTVQRLTHRLEGVESCHAVHLVPPRAERAHLRILGVHQGILQVGDFVMELSLRHTELLTVLALHPEGLPADRLADLTYGEGASGTTVRAEMLRLRKVLGPHAGTIMPRSRPYRLPSELTVDAVQVVEDLGNGVHRRALGRYAGTVLPRSEAPALVRLREDTSALIRDAVFEDGSCDTVLRYLELPEAEYDLEAWRLGSRLLPRRSSRRAALVSHLGWLEQELPVPEPVTSGYPKIC
ncbi:GAF domain-containing protein [Arthrobacter sp. RIT-PI-e]|uniref:GAF domain-containing protein n=1 Tax=Arthrobacter sp. RIT-PI-e TaxID=1681197 RepID=UPI001F24901F|nr:GAF domain-containing protein [Arthrobacter sp. RIT-PI-e]